MTFMYKFLCGHVSLLLGIYLRVKLLSHVITLFLTYCVTAKLLSKTVIPLYTLSVMHEGSISLHPCQYLLSSALVITALEWVRSGISLWL